MLLGSLLRRTKRSCWAHLYCPSFHLQHKHSLPLSSVEDWQWHRSWKDFRLPYSKIKDEPPVLKSWEAWPWLQLVQGDSVAAARFLQRSAMAAAAAAAQEEESALQGGPLPVTRFLLPETSLAGFLGHVQIGFARATDKQGWMRLEHHLENVGSLSPGS